MKIFHAQRPRNEVHTVLGHKFTFTRGLAEIIVDDPVKAEAVALLLRLGNKYTDKPPDWYQEKPMADLRGRMGYNSIQVRARELGWEGLARSRAEMEAFVLARDRTDHEVTRALRAKYDGDPDDPDFVPPEAMAHWEPGDDEDAEELVDA